MISRAAAYLAAFVLIAGCGSEEGGGDGGGKDDDPLAMLAQAARKSADTESFRYELTMDSDIASESMTMDASGTSSADSSEATLKGTMDAGEGALEFEGIITEGSMYMSGEDLGLPAGKWVKMEDSPTNTMSPSEFVKFLQDSGDVEVVIDIWVPDSGLPSRMAIDMKMPGQEGNLKMTSDVLEYDVPVNADPPPDDKVIESPGG